MTELIIVAGVVGFSAAVFILLRIVYREARTGQEKRKMQEINISTGRFLSRVFHSKKSEEQIKTEAVDYTNWHYWQLFVWVFIIILVFAGLLYDAIRDWFFFNSL